MNIKVIITGSTGLVGEGVLIECLHSPDVDQVLMLNRRPSPRRHPKLRELLVPDFLHLQDVADQLRGYDACFYCAGISAVGLSEADYRRITYDTTLHVAETLLAAAPALTFVYISGQGSGSTSRMMWARVKGETENALFKRPFKHVYALRPGMMKPTEGQKNIKPIFKFMASLYPITSRLFPGSSSTMKQVGLAMINSVLKGYEKQIVEVKDINLLASRQ